MSTINHVRANLRFFHHFSELTEDKLLEDSILTIMFKGKRVIVTAGDARLYPGVLATKYLVPCKRGDN